MKGVRGFLLGVGLLSFVIGCSSKIQEILPAGGEITGWDEDTSRGLEGLEVATDTATAAQLIDGAIQSVENIGTWEKVAVEYYQNADNTKIMAFVIEMTSAALGAKAYDQMRQYNSNFDWEDMSFGGGEDQGRAGPDIEEWYADIQKGRFFLQFAVKPKTVGETNKPFITSVLGRIK